MNKLTQAMDAMENETITQNGMRIKKSSKDALVDLFFAIGALRGQHDRAVELFQQAFNADKELAVRIALYARDVRGGMGERENFRRMMKDFAIRDFKNAKKVIPLIPEVGRWDDLFVFLDTPVEKEALDHYASALRAGDAMASKWSPREKGTKSYWASKLRKHMGLQPREYRKLIVANTDVVEQKMSSNQWKDIKFDHVPSLAAIRYQKAFERHVPSLYNKYITKLETGEAKINAGAVYPHDVVMSLNQGNERVAEQQWKALPDFLESGKSFIPIVDTSGSMGIGVSGSVKAIDISTSLGIYLAQRNKSVFKDKFITFSESPSWVDLSGLGLKQAVNKTFRANWGMNTNLEAAFAMILKAAVNGKVPQGDMPEYLLIMSDMQFDMATRTRKNKPYAMIKEQFKEAGYEMPKIVFWNLRDYGSNTPVTANKDDVALVSGFSPSIMTSVLGDPEQFTPWHIMMKAIGVPRYDWKKTAKKKK